MDPVSEFYEDDTDIVRHCKDDLTDTFGLLDFGGGGLHQADLGYALDQVSRLFAEGLFDLWSGDLCVLQDVVQDRGHECCGIHFHVGQHVGYLQRMAEIGLSGAADLSFVCTCGEHIGFLE